MNLFYKQVTKNRGPSITPLLCAAILCFAFLPGDAVAQKQEQPPTVKEANGQHVLILTEGQQSAVTAYLKANPGMSLANCENLASTPEACKTLYTAWANVVRDSKISPQYPFASWGDFNHDGFLDIVLPFFSNTAVNAWGWRTWQVVVFQGSASGAYRPVVAAKDSWGACWDGMLFHPGRKQIEYWCGSVGGSFRWNGSRYVARAMIGD